MIDAISPLDGRYGPRLRHLADYFSERALMRARCEVELRYLQALERTGLVARLDAAEAGRVAEALARFTDADYARIKDLERTTGHDVKACERFLREKLALRNPNLVHFGLTSEDVNNLAYSLLLRAYVEREQRPLLDRLLLRLAALAERWAEAPFPARTHGQKASPTTAGKELAVFLARLVRLRRGLRAHVFAGKLNGATGNHSAWTAAFPGYDWIAFSRAFVEGLGLRANLYTTQIEDHDAWAEHFLLTRQIANVALDLDQDLWLYISYGYLRERTLPDQVGSSAMPHKVNPIHFENSEGNLQLANALLAELADKLCRSRMQRDLSDSTVSRNIGVALAHAHLALEETLVGLEGIDLDAERCRAELDGSPELLAEPIQTVLRLSGLEDPYEQLRRLTRGKAITREELDRFVERVELPGETRERLRALRVSDYLGLAPALCRQAVAEARQELAAS